MPMSSNRFGSTARSMMAMHFRFIFDRLWIHPCTEWMRLFIAFMGIYGSTSNSSIILQLVLQFVLHCTSYLHTEYHQEPPKDRQRTGTRPPKAEKSQRTTTTTKEAPQEEEEEPPRTSKRPPKKHQKTRKRGTASKGTATKRRPPKEPK
eukprot:969217_1